MNTCKRYSESFSDFIENAIPAEQRRALETHLSACAGCQAAIARLQSLRGALNNLSKMQAPPDFEAVLRARIRRDGKRAPVSAAALPMRLPMMPRLAVFAMAGALIFMAANFLLRSNPHSAPGAAVFSVDHPLQTPLHRTVSPVIPLTAQIFYTLDKFSPKQWPASRNLAREAPADSLSVNPEELPRGPQNSRASLFSL